MKRTCVSRIKKYATLPILCLICATLSAGCATEFTMTKTPEGIINLKYTHNGLSSDIIISGNDVAIINEKLDVKTVMDSIGFVP